MDFLYSLGDECFGRVHDSHFFVFILRHFVAWLLFTDGPEKIGFYSNKFLQFPFLRIHILVSNKLFQRWLYRAFTCYRELVFRNATRSIILTQPSGPSVDAIHTWVDGRIKFWIIQKGSNDLRKPIFHAEIDSYCPRIYERYHFYLRFP